MARYVIEEDRVVWIREVYEVEADSLEEAEETYRDGGYLGFSVKNTADWLDAERVSIEQTDATPWIDHPFNDTPLDAAQPVDRI
jgi:hypothetical protein